MAIVVIMYGVYLLLKNYSSLIQTYFEKKIIEGEKTHTKATMHRKMITPKIRQILSDLALEVGADRVLLFEYSNGSSNLVGLPFLYVSATSEVVTRRTNPVSNQYQRINVSLVADFLEKLEDKGYFYVENIESIKNEYPMLYNMMFPNKAHSALFYSLSGMEDTIGFIVVTTTGEHKFTREQALPKVASISQVISSYLNFDALNEEL